MILITIIKIIKLYSSRLLLNYNKEPQHDLNFQLKHLCFYCRLPQKP